MKRYQKIFAAVFTLLVAIAVVVHSGSFQVVKPPAQATQPQKPKVSASGMIETSAQSAVLMDSNGNILFEKDSHKQLPPASVTKVMTMLLAVEALEQGKVNLNDQVEASQSAWQQGGSQIWLEPGERFSFQELLTAVAVASANDAAVAVAEHVAGSQDAFVALMNQRAEELGCKDTHFVNVNGLPTAQHYMSAYDTALIVRQALQYPKYMELVQIKEHWLRGGKTWLVNTNKLLWWYRGADGLKTGWTEEAKYCLAATAMRNNLRLISVVFATPEPRSHFREAMKLLDYGFANFEGLPVIDKGAVVERVRVRKGLDKELALVAEQGLNLTLAKGKNKNITKKIIVDPKIDAPVMENQKIGEMIVLQDNQAIASVNLIAAKPVGKAGVLQIFREMVGDLLTF